MTRKAAQYSMYELDCMIICTLLSHAFDGATMKKLCRKYDCGDKKGKEDPNMAFYTMHHECHKKESKLREYVEIYLTNNARSTTKALNELSDKITGSVSSTIQGLYRKDPAAVLWALISDTRQEYQNFGTYMIHKSGLNHHSTTVKAKKCSCLPINHTDNPDLQKIKELKDTAAGQARQIKGLTQQNKTLQKQLETLKRRPDELSAMARKIRKLEYELTKQKAVTVSLEEAIPPPTSFDVIDTAELIIPETTKTKDRILTTTIDGDDTCALSCDSGCSDCILNQLKVAIVGGIDRMMPKYKSMIRTMGGELLYHNGKCSGRRALALRSTICDADVVVFITTINSHNALDIAKAECKKTGKKFIVMRETSPDRLRQVISQNLITEEIF